MMEQTLDHTLLGLCWTTTNGLWDTRMSFTHLEKVYKFMIDVSRSARFGVHYVDFEDANRTRTPKESAIQLTKIFADNGFAEPSSGVTSTLYVVLPIISVVVFSFQHFLSTN